MDGVRLDPWDDMTRLPPEQRRLAEIEAAWRSHEIHGRRHRGDHAPEIRSRGNCTPKNRDRLAEAQNWRCCYCGVRMAAETGDRRATFEHVLPRALGGGDVIENLAISCQNCNAKRGMEMRPEHIEALGVAWPSG